MLSKKDSLISVIIVVFAVLTYQFYSSGLTWQRILDFGNYFDKSSYSNVENNFGIMSDRPFFPDSVVPVHYDLTFKPDLERFTFSGSETIKVNIVKATNVITMNSKQIEIQSASVKAKGSSIPAKDIIFDTAKETVELIFDQTLGLEDGAEIFVEFTGMLNDSMAGFYRSAYIDEASKERRHMAVTQFEAADARRAFPCWDKPYLKATFNVTLVVPKDRVALSNMPEKEKEIKYMSENGRELKSVPFETTPVMSTYLLAFVVGEFDHIEATTKGGVKVRVFTPIGKTDEGTFALKVATETLDFFCEYFDIAYPLPKSDLIAIPDFAAGAMENWGLVTYRSVLLLYNEKTTPAVIKQRIAYVIGHELAHQWFGNLVTMQWWSELWLNEGFATWVGWLATDHLFPDWKVWEQFIINEQNRAFSLDALHSSHPIKVDVPSDTKVDDIFDAISYSKGASIIKMLANYLGLDDFKKGLQLYLKKNAYKNAATDDLWDALSTVSGKPVKRLMDNWTMQMGYPVVSLEGNANGCCHAKQARFLSTGKDENDKSKWIIPLSLNTGDVVENSLLMEDEEMDLSSKGGFIKLNHETSGFFRVQYSPELIPTLGPLVKAKKLSAEDRVGLVSDVFSLAAAGYCPTESALALLDYYEGEDSFVVWSEISSQLSKLQSTWYEQGSEVSAKLKALKRKLFGPLVAKYGWEPISGETHLDAMLRSIAIGNAGMAGEEKVVAEAKRRFDIYCKGEKSIIHPDMRGSVFSIVLRNGDEATYNEVKKLLEQAESQDQKVTLLSSIGSGATPDLVKKALELVHSDIVRAQDVPALLRGCAVNSFGRKVTWHFLRDNWAKIYEKFSTTAMLLGRTVEYCTDLLASHSDADEIEQFFKVNNGSEVERNLKQSLERIRAAADWIKRDALSVETWLKNSL
eukprot:Nk52_evm58s221 gene=Nk52_evmTU58s221